MEYAFVGLFYIVPLTITLFIFVKRILERLIYDLMNKHERYFEPLLRYTDLMLLIPPFIPVLNLATLIILCIESDTTIFKRNY